MRRVISLVVVVVAFSATKSRADFTITIVQSGTSVIATGTGTLNLNALTADGSGTAVTGIRPNNAAISLGGPPIVDWQADFYTGNITGPSAMGPGGFRQADHATGNNVLLNFPNQRLDVESGYQSGDPLNGTATWDNTTISGLGLTPGKYTWSWGVMEGGTLDTFNVEIPNTVPAPSSMGLLISGTAALMLACRRGRFLSKLAAMGG